MRKFYHVTLTSEERRELQRMITSGKHAARKLAHARILLLSDSGPEGPAKLDREIREALGVAMSTIERVRQRFVEEGLEAALVARRPRRVYQRKLDGDGEARLTMLACSKPPDGRKAWTLDLLADQMVVYGYEISRSTVDRTLKKTKSSPG